MVYKMPTGLYSISVRFQRILKVDRGNSQIGPSLVMSILMDERVKFPASVALVSKMGRLRRMVIRCRTRMVSWPLARAPLMERNTSQACVSTALERKEPILIMDPSCRAALHPVASAEPACLASDRMGYHTLLWVSSTAHNKMNSSSKSS